MANELSAASFLKAADKEQSFKGIEVPKIEAPKGGGALKSIDEKFSVNAVNGTASISIPVPVTQARSMTPSMAISYDSGRGNGIFGMGWGIDTSSISRSTDRRLPRYEDAEESDTFVISGAEDLVPMFDKDENGFLMDDGKGGYMLKKSSSGNYFIQYYLPRTEGSFQRIERLTHKQTGIVCWRVTSRNNLTTYFGLTEQGRISDPDNPLHTFKWFPELAVDHMGNCLHYIYKEDASNRYLSKILYGNHHPYDVALPTEPDAIRLPADEDFFFSIVFNYGEYSQGQEVREWTTRPDSFSSYRSGFEIRTKRLCQSIMLFHHFEELGGRTLVRSVDFTYSQDECMTLLDAAVQKGYIRRTDGSYSEKSFPAQVFTYEKHAWQTEVIIPRKDPQIPAGITGGWLLTDLYNEGIPGLLFEQNGVWYYKHNLGEGIFGEAVKVLEKPSFFGFPLSLIFSDLDGNGRKQLVNMQSGQRGFFPMDDNGRWNAFHYFDQLPNIDINSPEVCSIDLNGDGRPDILITEDHALTWYASLGRKGYGERISIPAIIEENNEPAVMFSDATQSIFLADMTGDGRTDIVRIRQGEVCYWPNMGYGRFGEKVTMENSPVFEGFESFNPQQFLLADINGTGTTDIVYMGTHGFRIWLNCCGNSFKEEPLQISSFPEIHSMVQVTMSDILGTGTACIVWSSALGKDQESSLRYIDLMASRKPYLLVGYSNSMGKEVSLNYRPSTAYYLEDKKTGNPWNTTVHFPVHCLEKITTRDLITGWVFANSYRYHDGYYDHEEKEFRGFAFVEQKDIERIDVPDASNLQNKRLDQDPVISRSWMHTGAMASGDVDVESSKLLHGYDMSNLTMEERRQAVRCMRGSVMKNEVCTEDGMLYQRQTSRSKVQLIQPKGQNDFAVFMSVPVESITYSYEKNLDDPRIKHGLTLDTDEYGQILKSVQIAYPRQIVDNTLPLVAQQFQTKTVLIYSQNLMTSDINNCDVYMLRQPAEAMLYEVKKVAHRGELYALSDFSDIDQQEKELLSHSKVLYYDENLLSPLPLYSHSFPSIAYENYQQVYKESQFDDIFEGRVTEAMLKESKYVKSDDNTWWVRSGNVYYCHDRDTIEDVKARFYTPLYYLDAFGARTMVDYYKDYFLFVQKVTNIFGCSSEIREFDFRTMQPTLISDVNGNLTGVVTDELGMVKASAAMGKGDEADNLEEQTDITTDEEHRLIVQLLAAEKPSDITTIARQLLKHASMRYLYFPNQFIRYGKPVTTIGIIREEYDKVNALSPLQVSYEYSSGLGASVLQKVQAENAPYGKAGNDAFRWLGNGRTILNNKGKAIMQFEPYFSDTPQYEDAPEMVEQGVSPVMHYDALGRLVRTDFPDGTFQEDEFDAWSVTSFDAGDSVKKSDWYQTHLGDEAAIRSEVYDSTPSKVCYDTQGQPAVMIDCLRNEEQHQHLLITQAVRDVLGNILYIVDPRGNKVMSYAYDMLSRPLYQCGMDNGQRWMLTDMEGKPSYAWDERGFEFETLYDVLKRPTLSIVRNREERTENIIARVIYGEDKLSADLTNIREIQARNLLGNAVQVYDTAGLVETDAYDFHGVPLQTRRRLAMNYKETVNWTENNLEADLEQEVYATSMKIDALGRVTEQTFPDGTVATTIFNAGGLMSSQHIRFADGRKPIVPLSNVIYNARRQREYVSYGNGVSVRYTFDPLTYRITNIRSTKEDGTCLQDLSYIYDVTGMVVKITDATIPTMFFRGQEIHSASMYQYDSLGRLLSATGRENDTALELLNTDNYSDEAYCHMLYKGDAKALRYYKQSYSYDDAGNILLMKHNSDAVKWTREYVYEDQNNRLKYTKVDGFKYEYSYHEKHGFITTMPHLSRIGWDPLERITCTSKQVRNDGGEPETTYYQYDGTGQRVRKVTECQSANSTPHMKSQRIYMGSYECYHCRFGANAGLERSTISVLDGGHRYVIIEHRNEVDDGTVKDLTRYELYNHLGSSCLEIDQKAEIISYEEYHPYGTTAYQANYKEIKTSAKRYRYTGMERDEETGLSYHSARYYIAWLGRWLSCDPIGIDGGINLYCYCNCAPNMYSDTSGTDWVNRLMGGLQIIGGVAEGFAAANLFGIAGAASATGVGVGIGALAATGGVVLTARAADNVFTGGKHLFLDSEDRTYLAEAATGWAEIAGSEKQTAHEFGDNVELGACWAEMFVSVGSFTVNTVRSVKAVKAAKAISSEKQLLSSSAKTYSVDTAAINVAKADATDMTRIADIYDMVALNTVRIDAAGMTRIAGISDMVALTRIANASKLVPVTDAVGMTRIANIYDMVALNTVRIDAAGMTRIAGISDMVALTRIANASKLVPVTDAKGMTRIGNASGIIKTESAYTANGAILDSVRNTASITPATQAWYQYLKPITDSVQGSKTYTTVTNVSGAGSFLYTNYNYYKKYCSK